MKYFPSLGVVLFLVGCQTIPDYPEIKMTDLMLKQDNQVVRYLDATGPLPEPKWWMID